QRVEADGGFGADADSLGGTSPAHPRADGRFASGHCLAAALPDGIEHHEVADRGWHPQAAGDRLRIQEQLGESLALLESTNDRGTALGLAGDQPWETRSAERGTRN